MMICPETFYEMKLKGKTAAEIMTVIRGLKQEIGRLKNIAEHPEYQCLICPSEEVRIECLRLYSERAKQALVEAGGTYVPSAAEKKAMDFDANIPYINKVVISMGGFFNREIKTYIINDDEVYMDVEQSLILKPFNVGPWDKADFLDELKHLHIGEWKKRYTLKRYGYKVCDGTQWSLDFYFSNGHKPVEIYGDNAYPYNFDRLMDLFEIKEEY